MSGTDVPSGSLRGGAGRSWAPYPKLHPGPGRPREQVASHQRARIYAAMIEFVSERGYGAVTTRELVRLAGVSKHTFYEHFRDKEECFLCTYDLLVRRSMKLVGAAQRDCGDWRERQRLAFRAWADGIACAPRAARLALVEAFAAGPAARERMRRAEGLFATMIEQSFAAAPDTVPVSPLLLGGIVAGVHRVARAQLLAGRAHVLPGLTDELLEWVLCFRCEAAMALERLDPPAAPLPDGAARALSVEDGAGAGDDRARILDAAMRLAAEEGYGQLTIPRIRLAAGVSRKRFDAHFVDVQGCFAAALEHLSGCALAHAAAAAAAGRGWPGGLHRALHALCAYIAADPVLARLGFVEVLEPGLDGMRCRAHVIADAAAGLRASAPAGQRPSELSAEASVGAIWGIVHRHIVRGRAHELTRIAPMLSFLTLAPAIGPGRAAREILAEQARMCEDGGTPGSHVRHEYWRRDPTVQMVIKVEHTSGVSGIKTQSA